MKVKKIFTSTIELELNITEATLLTVDEAKLLPERLKAYRNWWLRSPGGYADFAAYVDYNGFINSHGDYIRNNLNVVRPALIISNLESSEFKFGDRFEFGGKEFEIVFDYLAFCLTDIGQCAFKRDWNADDKNNYEQSDVKKFIDEWFKNNIEEVNNEENEIKETNKNESIYKCRDCRSELRCPCDPNSDACGLFYPTNRFLIKTEESLLEKFLSEENKPLSPQERDVLLHLIEKDLNKRKY